MEFNYDINPEGLCKKMEENASCFLKNNLYAHATTYDNAQNILKEGIRVQSIENRIHKEFDPELAKICEEHGIYSKACKNRAENIFFYADLHGAMNHTQYMGELKGVNFEKPAIIIADLTGRNVQPDIENLRNEKRKTTKQIIEEYSQAGDSVPVSVKGSIPPKDVQCICTLTDSFFDTLRKPFDFEDFYDNPNKYGFDPKDHDVMDESDYDIEEDYYDALNEAQEEFLESKELQGEPNFSEYVKHLNKLVEDDSKRSKYGYVKQDEETSRAYNFIDEISEKENWECKCRGKLI